MSTDLPDSFIDEDCITVTSYRKKMKARDLFSLIRLALKKANNGRSINPVSITLITDRSVNGSSYTYHIGFSRKMNQKEIECIRFQLTRECEVLGKLKGNRFKQGIFRSNEYLFHEGHNSFITKQIN